MLAALHGIFYFNQAKSSGVRGFAGRSAVFFSEDLFDTSFFQPAAGHIEQGPDDVADHFIEEAVGFDVDVDEILLFSDMDILHSPYRADPFATVIGGGSLE